MNGGNFGNAVQVTGFGTNANVVAGNDIGVDPGSTAARANGTAGIGTAIGAFPFGGPRVGTACTGGCNVISGAARTIVVTGTTGRRTAGRS